MIAVGASMGHACELAGPTDHCMRLTFASAPTDNPPRSEGILPARMLSSGVWGEAVPDVLFGHDEDDEGFSRTAIEVELTYKKPAELKRKFEALRTMLAEDSSLRVRWLFPAISMAQHYERTWRSGDSGGHHRNAVTFNIEPTLTKPL